MNRAVKSIRSNKLFRYIFFIVLDILTICAASFLEMAVRFDFFTIAQNDFFPVVVKCLPIDCAIAIVVMAFFKLYNRVWSYVSVSEIRDIARASLVIEVIFLAYRVLFSINLPRSFYPINLILIFTLFCASRFSIRVVKRLTVARKPGDNTQHVMVVGGGDAGAILINDINSHENSSRVVCVVDDNESKIGNSILGVKIYGNRDDIPELVRRFDINEIIIAIPSAKPDEIRGIIETCKSTKCRVKIMPKIASSMSGSIISTIRDIKYEDLLQREPVSISNPELRNSIAGKTVMVTGGGGSIGSELCRQLLANKPGKLVIVDIYENTSYMLELELRNKFPDCTLEVCIGSVRDYDRMDDLFSEYKPQLVYHAAAHKHVPLMEDSPNEAIKNNCLGTLNLAMLADKHEVEKFVMISTDKAVNPTNVMGASKRICEMIVQTYNKRSKTEFVAVRFGNVLGSNGSVIHIFNKQIEQGGPVTLTDRRITRFFMTITEAVSLVLTAGLMAKGGEIFVLDMGEPVKIYDLACQLIRMNGYEPEKDIKIDVIGLRPGEKLYEELLMDEEGLEDTEHHLIHIGKPIQLDEDSFLDELNELIQMAYDNQGDIVAAIKNICPTYNPKKK